MAVANGSLKRVIVTEPPRHGKSTLVSHYFPAWYLGAYPDKRVMLTSYEADFASTWGRKAREVLEEFGPSLFGIKVSSKSSAADRWDIEGHAGGMVTAGMRGALTGKGADVLICDDPVKNAEEADSDLIQEKIFDWWKSTAYTRLEPNAAIVIVMTRWNKKDLVGRLLDEMEEGGEEWTVIDLPAIATEDDDILGRKIGEALWPERYDEEALMKIKVNQPSRWWWSLYQGSPINPEGSMFKREWFKIVDARDAPPNIIASIRYWDFAATKKKKKSRNPCFTSGTLVHYTSHRQIIIGHNIKFRETPAETDKIVREIAEEDGYDVWVYMECEPGSGGIKTVDHYARIVLPGWVVRGNSEDKDKVLRAHPYSAQCELGNVWLIRAGWISDWLDEHEEFPFGRFMDQVDSASGGVRMILTMPVHNRPIGSGSRTGGTDSKLGIPERFRTGKKKQENPFKQGRLT